MHLRAYYIIICDIIKVGSIIQSAKLADRQNIWSYR